MGIKAIIIEDELYPRKVLVKLLESHCPQVSVVASCQNAQDGMEAIHQHDPDLIFLDIDMPGMNGIEMLRQLEEIDFDIIFTTAHDEYALEAVKVSPVDYLLKPIDENELVNAVDRLMKRRSRSNQQRAVRPAYYKTADSRHWLPKDRYPIP
ncbi:MAG TPA: response regulator [Saprospiraceae bacterium]|nr:response regulator [Saprospiraceae bacterium]